MRLVLAFEIVLDAPAVGGFGELLIVDQHEHRSNPAAKPQGKRLPPISPCRRDFADLKGHVPPVSKHGEAREHVVMAACHWSNFFGRSA